MGGGGGLGSGGGWRGGLGSGRGWGGELKCPSLRPGENAAGPVIYPLLGIKCNFYY